MDRELLIDLVDDIRASLNALEQELLKRPNEKMRGYFNGEFSNAGKDGNFDVEGWNESIKNDR